ncbi:hypothetical protein [Burkholderia territorii]|uniref:hypothetical protein n=1 Tax=Burkholderia territorii TaxID=1503055 RepID=UPI0007584493|nr:hypothetical protein [Burkholderia territorii]KUZ36562.1 hypothetical protein WS52_16045 [Burkholderia territorii]KUZ52862.1 hypothetical protein WS53_17455 [Burkholderia territorii]
MNIRYSASLALLITVTFPAFSAGPAKDYDPAATRCAGFDDAGLAKLISQLDYAAEALPNIPPEEDRYLTAESSAALKVYVEEQKQNNWEPPTQGQGNMRFAALAARPLYTVWKVRKDLAEAKRAIAGIVRDGGPARSYKGNPEAEKLERATRAIGPISTYSLQMQEFLTRQTLAQNNNMLVTPEQWARLYSGALTLDSGLGYYMSCKLAKIMGRQSFE